MQDEHPPRTDDGETAVVISHLRREVEVESLDPPAGAPARVRCFQRSTAVEVVTGDRVTIERDAQRPDHGVIAVVHPRRSLLARRHRYGGVRPICANLDVLLITIAPDPAPHADLIDRYLVAAHIDGLDAMLVLNKCDLPQRADPEVDALLALYRGLGLPVFETSAVSAAGIDALQRRIGSRTAALVGQSGVGKSSLINALVPGAHAEIGTLSTKRRRGHRRGRHTTSTTRLYRLNSGLIIDSPGIRELAPEIPDLGTLAAAFPEIADAADRCRFRNCRHDGEPGCTVAEALDDGRIDPRRWRSYCLLREEIPAAHG